MSANAKLTEDETVILLANYLSSSGWTDVKCCFGQKRGHDIEAVRNGKRIYIEVKGARAGDNSPTKKREHFDGGQIKTHFGRAIVKVLESKYVNPDAIHAIAQPDDEQIRKAIGDLTPSLTLLGIKHFWVSPNGAVIEQ